MRKKAETGNDMLEISYEYIPSPDSEKRQQRAYQLIFAKLEKLLEKKR